MMRNLTRFLGALGLAAVAFSVGAWSAEGGGRLHASRGGEVLEMPQNPGQAPGNPLPTEPTEGPLVFGGDSGQSAAANGVIAVTGSYGVGTSVLYVLDTKSGQLAVYEAKGGSPGSRRLVLVGARRIDLDLQLEGYNDESEFSYRDLAQRFERVRSADPSAAGSGATGSAGSGAESGSGDRRK